MATTTYVTLDTNILIRVLKQEQPGCEIERFRELRDLVVKNQVTLLIAEVVLLEFEKGVRVIPTEIKAAVGKFKSQIKQPLEEQLKNELADLRANLESDIEELTEAKLRTIAEYEKEVRQLLKPDRATILPFDNDIWVRGKKRLIRGGLADPKGGVTDGKAQKPKSPQDQDCCVIESLVKFFEDKKPTECQLLICSDDRAAYALEDKEKSSLHPVVQEGLPPGELFTTLTALVAFIKKGAKVEQPSAKDIKKSLERKQKQAIEDMLKLTQAVAFTNPFAYLPPGTAEALRVGLALSSPGAILRALSEVNQYNQEAAVIEARQILADSEKKLQQGVDDARKTAASIPLPVEAPRPPADSSSVNRQKNEG